MVASHCYAGLAHEIFNEPEHPQVMADLDAAADYAQLVPSVRWLEPAEVLSRLPIIKPEAAAGGAVFEPEADDMDVAAIHGGFLKGARAAGAILQLNAEVTGLTRLDGLWTLVLRDGETVRAANIIDAAGAWADVLGGLAGCVPVGLVPKRRTAFTFDAPPGLDLGPLPMLIDFDTMLLVVSSAAWIIFAPVS